MNLVTVDVTNIADVQIGDEVLLLGNDLKVNAQTVAETCNTINYDVVTNISPSIIRKIVE